MIVALCLLMANGQSVMRFPLLVGCYGSYHGSGRSASPSPRPSEVPCSDGPSTGREAVGSMTRARASQPFAGFRTQTTPRSLSSKVSEPSRKPAQVNSLMPISLGLSSSCTPAESGSSSAVGVASRNDCLALALRIAKDGCAYRHDREIPMFSSPSVEVSFTQSRFP